MLQTPFLLGATLSLVTLVPGRGETWTVRNWQTDDGLPDNQITGLAQCADGFLWVGTYATPARFDGVRFEEFTPRQLGLGANQKVTALARRGDTLWLGTVAGTAVRLDGRTVTTFATGVPHKPVVAIVFDGAGTAWIAQQGGFITRLRDGHTALMSTTDGLPPPNSPTRYGCSIAIDGRGRLWWARNGRAGLCENDRFVTLAKFGTLPLVIGRADDGGMWVCAAGRVYHLAEGHAPELRWTLPVGDTAEPAALREDRAGRVWVGMRTDGLFVCQGDAVSPVPVADRRITTLGEDASGGVWAGTLGGGVNRLTPSVVVVENAATGLPAGAMQSLAHTEDGSIWATTQAGQLLRRRDGRWETVSNDPRWPGGRAATVVAGPDGAVWIGTRDHALHRWQSGTFSSWRPADGLVGREIHALTIARNGDVWIGATTPNAVQRLHAGRFEQLPTPANLRVIRAATEDAHGDVWFGTSSGILLRCHDSTVTDETPRTTGEPLSIRCLATTPDGAVWIGYADEGIGWLKDHVYRRCDIRCGMPEGNVAQLLPDARGNLWISGDHGVFRVSLAAFTDCITGQGPVPPFVRYGRSEGLLSAEGNFGDAPGVMLAPDGRVWLPLRTGVAVIDPARIQPDRAPPRLLVRRVWVDDRVAAEHPGPAPLAASALPMDVTLRLPPGHSKLHLDYTAPNFAAPENMRFRYRLAGYEDSWTNAGSEREVTFTRLPAGAYRFEVEARNAEGVWSTTPATVGIVVAPFWWESWWFRVGACGVLVGGTVTVVRRAAVRRMQSRLRELEHQAAVQRERTRIARDLHDEFGTRLTELGLIAELADASGGERDELKERIHALERDLDTIVWTVNPRNDRLDHLVAFLCRVVADFLERSGVRCRFDIPEDLPAVPVAPELRHHVFLTVREAVNNVVRHAAATTVTLAVRVTAESLAVTILDDGSGFDPAAAARSGRNGLGNMRTRIEELGGRFALETQPTGTRVAFLIPLTAAGSVAAGAFSG